MSAQKPSAIERGLPEVYMPEIMSYLNEIARLIEICDQYEALDDASGFWLAGDKIMDRCRKVSRLLNNMKASFLEKDK